MPVSQEPSQQVTEPPAPAAAPVVVADEDPPVEESEEGFDVAKALEKIRKTNSENKTLRDRSKAAETRAATAEEQAKLVPGLQAELVRERIARRLSLPDSLVSRLKGSSEEEVQADAEKLLADIAAVMKPAAPKNNRPVESLKPGSGKDPQSAQQLSREDLKGMTPEAIVAARREGRLSGLLGQ